MLSLDTAGRALVRRQRSDETDFVDSPWEAICFLRTRWRDGVRRRWEERGEGKKGELGLIRKI